MLYESKLAAMMKGSLPPDRILMASQLASVGVRSRPEYLRRMTFEAGVAMHSPVAGATGSVLVGAHSYMNDGGYMRDRVAIGRYCSIGRRVTIAAGMHAMHSLSTAPILRLRNGRAYDTAERAALGIGDEGHGWTVIGHDVWIGDGAIVMPGVRIGVGSVIGANAVVTRDVPAYTVVAGVPARNLRPRFPAGVVAELLRLRWWEWAPDTLKTFAVGNVFEFIEQAAERAPKAPDRFDTYTMVPV